MPARLIRYCQRNKIPIFSLGAIVLLASLLRFLFLDRIPNIITSDELTYLLTAKAIALTGSGITSAWYPLSVFIFHYPHGAVQAELPYFLLFPVVGFFPFSLFTAHITYAGLSVLLAAVVYLIGRELFDAKVGLAAGLLMSINPWLIAIGRTAYEMVPAMLFFMLTLYLLLVLKRRKILWVIVPAVLAFYSYIGTKTVLVPFLLAGVLYVYYFVRNKKDGKYYAVVIIASLLLTLFYLASIMLHPSVSRLGEILTPFSAGVSGQVDVMRKISIETFLTPLVINKFSIYFSILLSKLFASLSFNYLFTTGDSFFSFWNHGLFYTFDAVFLLVGILELFRKKVILLFFLITMLFIGLIPQLLHGVGTDNFTPHITLIFPFALLIAAFGIVSVLQSLRKHSLLIPGLLVISVLYTGSVIGFMQDYFYQNSLQKQSVFNDRIASRYVSIAAKEGKEIAVYSPHLVELFQKYLFYSNAYNRQTAMQVRKDYASNVYSLGTIHFLPCDQAFTSDSDEISVYDNECGSPKIPMDSREIKQLSDGGDAYLIYHDTICDGVPLKTYPENIKLSDFRVEALSAPDFCSIYISE